VHFLEEPTCTPLESIRTRNAGNYRHGNTKRGLVSPIVNQSELRVDFVTRLTCIVRLLSLCFRG
jgi:hypothetical protein